MPIPGFQEVFKPLLKFLADGKGHTKAEAVPVIADEFGLTKEERREMLPSGNSKVFENRVAWARTYLKKAGLIEYPERGHMRITEEGRRVLAEDPPSLNVKYLKRYPEFAKFHGAKPKKKAEPPKPKESTPIEVVEAVHNQLREDLTSELLEKVVGGSPQFFEQLVVDLLLAMGYGGSRVDAGKAIGQSGDEGVDGIINEDRLGLDRIYIQAKRWKDNTVGRSELQKFAGALQGKKAKKGVFITTSRFSKGAREYASNIESRIVLIDGESLTNLMVDYNVGVSSEATYEVKKIDEEYFSGE